jgi:Type I phosphodiesterase / nucleotide pyrophosphatase
VTDWRFDPDDLERLFRRLSLSRRQFLGGLVALGMAPGPLSVPPRPTFREQATHGPSARYYVLIVVDALRSDYTPLTHMPALDALRRDGISYDRAWVGQLETLTPASHATLSTGLTPKNHGIVGLEWRDATTGKEALDGWEQGALLGQVGRDMKQRGVNSIPLAVKTADPKARLVSLSSEKVYAADAMGAAAADYVLYHRWSGTPNGGLVPAAIPGHVPPSKFFSFRSLTTSGPLKHLTDWDYLSGMLAQAAFREFRPRVLMVNLPGTDVYGHKFGGPATPAAMQQVVAGADRMIARIVKMYQAAGIYDQTVFVVVGDHGMVANYRTATSINQAVKAAGGQILIQTGGTASYIYLKNPQVAAQVASAVAQVPNVQGAYYQVTQQPKPSFVPAPGIAMDEGLNASYRYLLNTFAGPSGPDVVAPFRENTIGNAMKNAYGNHGGLSWGVQSVPMVITGPDVRHGAVSEFPARLMDVAPTVRRLLGLPAWRTDGIVLADALTAPTSQEQAKQSSISVPLTAYQDALIRQSQADVADDAANHVTPPASVLVAP